MHILIGKAQKYLHMLKESLVVCFSWTYIMCVFDIQKNNSFMTVYYINIKETPIKVNKLLQRKEGIETVLL